MRLPEEAQAYNAVIQIICMVFNIVTRLMNDENACNFSVSVFNEDFPKNLERLQREDILDVTRSFLHVRGGEDGYSERRISLDQIEEIRSKGRLLFHRKRKIKKSFPVK